MYDAFATGKTHVFSVDTTNPNSLVKYAGRLGISGIFQFMDVCAHEKGHQDAWKPQPPPDAIINTNSPTDDTNNDGVDDTWEMHHHFDLRSTDTTGAYTAQELGKDKPNQEVIADIPALGALLSSSGLWASDWAGAGTLADHTNCDGGVQWHQYPMAIRPGDTKPSHYFVFYPVVSGDKEHGFVVSTTGYQVWNLADIQTIVNSYVGGTVLTSLP